MFMYMTVSEMSCITCRPDLHNLQVRSKKAQKVANSWNITYCKCQN